jgi:DNA-binding MarR family transcriptional regulator
MNEQKEYVIRCTADQYNEIVRQFNLEVPTGDFCDEKKMSRIMADYNDRITSSCEKTLKYFLICKDYDVRTWENLNIKDIASELKIVPSTLHHAIGDLIVLKVMERKQCAQTRRAYKYKFTDEFMKKYL